MPSSNFQPIQSLNLYCCYKFTHLLANSADPDQLAQSSRKRRIRRIFTPIFAFVRVKFPSEDSHLRSISAGHPNWTSKTYRGLPKFPKLIPEMSKNCQKARPLLTNCMMFAPPTYWKFATCVDWALRTSHFPLAGVLLTSVSSVAAPFWWLRDHCVYLSRVLSWLIDVCIIKLSSATPENIRWNYMKSLLFLNIHVLKS